MLDIKHQIPIPRSSSPFPNDPWDSNSRTGAPHDPCASQPYSADSYSASGIHADGDDLGLRSPPGYADYKNSTSHELARPYKVQKQFEAEQFGYQAPSEQTTYDGAGGRFF